jgi:hypothetical protein
MTDDVGGGRWGQRVGFTNPGQFYRFNPDAGKHNRYRPAAHGNRACTCSRLGVKHGCSLWRLGIGSAGIVAATRVAIWAGLRKGPKSDVRIDGVALMYLSLDEGDNTFKAKNHKPRQCNRRDCPNGSASKVGRFSPYGQNLRQACSGHHRHTRKRRVVARCGVARTSGHAGLNRPGFRGGRLV